MRDARSWTRLVVVSLVLGTAGCSSARHAASMSAPPSLVLSTPQGGASTPTTAPSADRAMRITVETTIVVPHRDAAVSSLRELVASFGGYVSEGTVAGPDASGSASFTVKVPAAAVTDFRGKLARFGEVRSDSEKAEDVTEARADIKARLRNARAEDQRLLDLLATKTGNLGDVVLVEKELASVRETIERFEAEERTLEGQISFATVKVQLETVYVAKEEGPGHELAVAAKDGVVLAKDVVLGLVRLALGGGPTLVILGGLGYVAFRVLRSWSRRRRAARTPA